MFDACLQASPNSWGGGGGGDESAGVFVGDNASACARIPVSGLLAVNMNGGAYLSVWRSRIPRNHNRLIDMKQAVTLTGLGSQSFHTAVRGVSAVYHAFKMHLSAKGCQLRTWAPGCDAGQSLTLTFSNRILMSAKDAEGGVKRETKSDVIKVYKLSSDRTRDHQNICLSKCLPE